MDRGLVQFRPHTTDWRQSKVAVEATGRLRPDQGSRSGESIRKHEKTQWSGKTARPGVAVVTCHESNEFQLSKSAGETTHSTHQ